MRETLLELKDLLGDEFGSLVDAFRIDNRSHLESIKKGIVVSDTESVRLAAHSIKGASSNLGAIELAAACQELESAAKDNDLSQAEDQYELIRKLFDQAVEVLESV